MEEQEQQINYDERGLPKDHRMPKVGSMQLIDWLLKVKRHTVFAFSAIQISGLNLSLIRVITKLPNSEQSYKGKVKTHNHINRQNQSTTGNCENRHDPDLVQVFLKGFQNDFRTKTQLLICCSIKYIRSINSDFSFVE